VADTIMPLPVGVVAALLLFGNALAMGSQPVFSPLDAAWYNERGEVRIIGVVDRPPDRVDQSQRVQVRVERITPLYEGRSERSYPVKGLVLIQAPGATKLHYGDRVRMTGKLKTPPDGESFSYRDYLARKQIYSLMPVYGGISIRESGAGSPLLAGIYNLREQAYIALTRSIPQPEASLLAGILLGIETDMPDDLDRAFQNTGTSHIIAISGFNIAILSTLFCGIFIRFTPKLLAPFLAILAIAAYTVLVGAQASVVRAAIMGSIGLVGQVIGRRQAGANTLVFTAAVMCAFNPLVLSDAGFLLSFTATLGLILYADPLKTWFTNLASRRVSSEMAQRISGPVGEYFLFTAAAQVTTLPVILYTFGRLSVSSAVANPLILPAQPPVMILGGIAVMAGMALPQAGDVLAHLVTPCWPIPSAL
jgi:competence protein ComEC